MEFPRLGFCPFHYQSVSWLHFGSHDKLVLFWWSVVFHSCINRCFSCFVCGWSMDCEEFHGHLHFSEPEKPKPNRLMHAGEMWYIAHISVCEMCYIRHISTCKMCYIGNKSVCEMCYIGHICVCDMCYIGHISDNQMCYTGPIFIYGVCYMVHISIGELCYVRHKSMH